MQYCSVKVVAHPRNQPTRLIATVFNEVGCGPRIESWDFSRYAAG